MNSVYGAGKLSGQDLARYFGMEDKPASNDYFSSEQKAPPSRFAVGGFRAQDFEDVFGLSSVAEDQAYSEGSTTGTKQVAGLGTYLTEDDFNRNRNSDKTWEAYAAVYGKDAANSKREGNPDGLSINALDALYDKLAAKPKDESNKLPEFPLTDPSAARAGARVESFAKNIRPNIGSVLYGKDGDKYYDQFKKDAQTNFENSRFFDYDKYAKEQGLSSQKEQGGESMLSDNNRRNEMTPEPGGVRPKGIMDIKKDESRRFTSF